MNRAKLADVVEYILRHPGLAGGDRDLTSTINRLAEDSGLVEEERSLIRDLLDRIRQPNAQSGPAMHNASLYAAPAPEIVSGCTDRNQ
jgi:hypothetical protein